MPIVGVGIMKKTIGLLIFLLLVLISVGKFYWDESSILRTFAAKFDAVVNIATKPENMAVKKVFILNSAAKNKLSLSTITTATGDSKEENGQKINFYLFLHDTEWFKESFKSTRIIENKHGNNKFYKADQLNILTAKKIQLLPLEELDADSISGDYHVKGEIKNIKTFVEELNGKNGLSIQAVIEPNPSIGSYLSAFEVDFFLSLILNLSVFILFSLFVYNSQLAKEIVITKLFGYKQAAYICKKTWQLFRLPFFLSLSVVTVAMLWLIKPNALLPFFYATKVIFCLFLITCVMLFSLEYFLLTLVSKRIAIIDWLKGYRNSYGKSSVLVKLITLIIVLYLFVISVLGINQYLELRPQLNTWEQAKNYVDLACTWPWTYEKEYRKFELVVAPKLNRLWDTLDKQGAIMFSAPNAEAEYEIFPDEKNNNHGAFYGRYAYINKNYLNINNLVDSEGRSLKEYQTEPNEWIIFVPENIKITDKDKSYIKKLHYFKAKATSQKLNDRYVRLKADQTTFGFDAEKKLDGQIFSNYSFILVNGEELRFNMLKIATLSNGQFHPFVPDRSNFTSIKETIRNTGAGQYILYINGVYDRVAELIGRFKKEAILNMLGLVISILIFLLEIKIDQDTYYYNDGQRIEASRLLGYSFCDVHGKKLWKNAMIYLAGVSGLIWLLRFGNSIPIVRSFFFEPRGGWDFSKYCIGFLLAVGGTVIGSFYEIMQLKRQEKSIVLSLKGGN